MCGIYGALVFRPDGSLSEDLLRRMGAVIVHRGPDDTGAYHSQNIALGMRRLSIIDLAGGHQPIANEDSTVWAVCNGEIYNFRELRRQLEKQGHRFKCSSDTEVLVHLYEQYGLGFVKHLRGMFAFALWDRTNSRLILARDRLGKKPLYTFRTADRILFASELKSILQAPEVPRRLNAEALSEYLALGYVPAPHTLLQGVEKVLPGHYLLVEKGEVRDEEYWDVDLTRTELRSEDEWTELLRDKLLESVRLRLVSDVPLGAFLSGGLDSSSIVAAMAKFSDQPIKTYSIGFEGKDQFYNELPYARMVAKAFSTDHHEIIVRPDVTDLLPKLIWHLDEPIADSAFITTYLVARLARESVTVILSGVGGDELFGGYRRYLGDKIVRYYQALPSFIRRRWLPAALSLFPKDRHSGWKNNIRYANAFVETASAPMDQRYISYITVFSPELRRQLLLQDSYHGNRDAVLALTKYFAKWKDFDALGQIIYADIKTSLADDLLALTDKMTMAASIECRAPFMDQELVELAARIPSGLKIRRLSLKYLFKKAVTPWLPAPILKRKKRGFGAPIGAWLRDDLHVLIKETISEEQVRRRGLFNWSTVKEVILRHETSQNDYTDNILALVIFELWCRIFLDGKDWPSTQTRESAVYV